MSPPKFAGHIHKLLPLLPSIETRPRLPDPLDKLRTNAILDRQHFLRTWQSGRQDTQSRSAHHSRYCEILIVASGNLLEYR